MVPLPGIGMLKLYGAIWRVSSRRQGVLIGLSLAIAALAAVPLQFQKDIVNLLAAPGAGLPDLYLLGAGMFAAILLSLLLKWVMGVRAGVLGEDVIRLIRRRLLMRATDADDQGGDVRRGTLTTAVSAEAEELGKFAGSAFSEPVVQIGTLVSVIGFILATQPGLGIVALSMIAPQIAIVLASQRQVNACVEERLRILRESTNRLSADQIGDVGDQVMEDFDRIFATRRRMFLWKLSAKFLISTINGIGVVAVLMLGGTLVVLGETDVGTVVAATVGLGRIQPPTAFLLAFYRQVSANRVKFELLREVIVAPQTSA